MKKFLMLTFLIFIIFICINKSHALYGNYDDFSVPARKVTEEQLIIPKGSFFRGFLGETVSSEFNNNGDIVKILINSDFTLNDKIILPKNSMFFGKIKNLEKAQQGRNGMFSIDIVAAGLPDGRTFTAKGYVLASKDNKIFGGEFARRSGHKNTVHRPSPFGRRGVLMLQQNGPRIMGKETKIQMGTLITLVLEEKIIIE